MPCPVQVITYERKPRKILGSRVSDGRQFLWAASFADRGCHRLFRVLRAQHSVEPRDTSHYSQAPPKPGCGFRASHVSSNDSAWLPCRFLSRRPILSGWRSDQDPRHQRGGHWICFSEYLAEFPGRLVAALG